MTIKVLNVLVQSITYNGREKYVQAVQKLINTIFTKSWQPLNEYPSASKLLSGHGKQTD